MASIPSWTVKVSSWWSVLRKSATFRAAARSGDPCRPMQKEWSLPQTPPADPKCLEAIDATRDESRPPESKTPDDMTTMMTVRRSQIQQLISQMVGVGIRSHLDRGEEVGGRTKRRTVIKDYLSQSLPASLTEGHV